MFSDSARSNLEINSPSSHVKGDQKNDTMTTMKPNSGSSINKNGTVFKNVKYEHLVAGISGGVTSTLILHPLDLVKIRFAGNYIFLSEIFDVF